MAALLIACGDDDPLPLGNAPDAGERELPGLGIPEKPDGGDAMQDAGSLWIVPDAGPCCMREFSVLESGDGEQQVHLHGDAVHPTVAEGYPLTLEDGVWSLSLCLPAGQRGIYYYVFSLPEEDEDGGVVEGSSNYFPAIRHNPSEPTQLDPVYGEVNTFTPQETCP